MENGEEDDKSMKKWKNILIILCLLFAIATIVIIVIALDPSQSNIPANVDVVLYQSSSPSDRMYRYIAQSKAVWRHMGWVRNVYLLSQYVTVGYNEVLGIEGVRFTGTDAEAFMHCSQIPGISSHFIYLSDRTVPFRHISKSYLFMQSIPRMFNVWRDTQETNLFASYFELPTMPCVVASTEQLKRASSWVQFVYQQVSETRVISREDLDRDVFVCTGHDDNVSAQFDKLVSNPPYFATFHINANDSDLTNANRTVNTFLNKIFDT